MAQTKPYTTTPRIVVDNKHFDDERLLDDEAWNDYITSWHALFDDLDDTDHHMIAADDENEMEDPEEFESAYDKGLFDTVSTNEFYM